MILYDLAQRFLCKFYYKEHDYYKSLEFELYGDKITLHKCLRCGKLK